MSIITIALHKGCNRPAIVSSLQQIGAVEQFGAIPLMLSLTAPESALETIKAIPGVKAAHVDRDDDFQLTTVDHIAAPAMPDTVGQMPLVLHGHKADAPLFTSMFDMLIPGKAITYRYDPTEVEGDGTGTNIYIVDSGVWSTHEEFNGTYGSQLYNGHGSDPLGFHGTACAGVAMGKTLGVAPGATVYDCRSFPTEGSVSSSFLISGMNAALTHFNANSQPGIMSCSFTGQSGTDAYDTVIDACVDAGLVVVTGAGNSGENLTKTSGTNQFWPAENVDCITAGGLDSYMRLHGLANYYGACDIYAKFDGFCAPTVGADDAYYTPGSLRGTSFSCPMVTGMIARALTGTTKMTSREEFDTFRAEFLEKYTVEDVGNFRGYIQRGLKRLWIPGVRRHAIANYTKPDVTISDNIPLQIDAARTSIIMGGRADGVSVRSANVHVILEG